MEMVLKDSKVIFHTFVRGYGLMFKLKNVSYLICILTAFSSKIVRSIFVSSPSVPCVFWSRLVQFKTFMFYIVAKHDKFIDLLLFDMFSCQISVQKAR